MDTPASRACGIHAARLNLADYAVNFGDAHPPLTRAQALIEAERCYYCFDAPCQTACPTGALGSFDPQRDKLGVAVVQKDRCIAYFEGCVECEKACPYEAIALDDVGHPVIDAAKCNGCGVCENVCPALVYRSFAGGSRRGVVVVAPERYERLGRTTVEGESEMIV